MNKNSNTFDKNYYKKVLIKTQTVAKSSGKYLARGDQVKAVSDNWNPQRLIIVEFDSMEKFNAWWNSADYRAIAPLREQLAKTNAVVAQGI